MAKMMSPKGKKASASKFIGVDEEYDKKTRKKEDRSMKTAGMEKLLEKAEKKQGYSDKPRVKPAKKGKGFVSGQKKVK
jgi:hypothetical protein